MKIDNFNMRRPCANCPFLVKGAIELLPGRLKQIMEGLRKDDKRVFICHKTVEKPTSGCMGALAVQFKEHRLPVLARFALSTNLLQLKDLHASGEMTVHPKDIKE